MSWLVIAAFQREPSVAAEARYLGVVTAIVVLAALHAVTRIGTPLGAAIVLLGAIPWALPGTADRGVAAGVLLAVILAIAVATESWPTRSDASAASVAISWSPSRITALVIGAQILARSGELLAPSTRDVVSVVAWAAVAAVAILLHAGQRGLPAAAVAGCTAFVLGPGFTMTTALALAAPALAALIADEEHVLRLAHLRLGRGGWPIAGWGLEGYARSARPRWRRRCWSTSSVARSSSSARSPSRRRAGHDGPPVSPR